MRFIPHDVNFEDINQFFCKNFCLVVKRFMITKNSVVEIQNLFLNYESHPFKSNPICKISFRLYRLKFFNILFQINYLTKTVYSTKIAH